MAGKGDDATFMVSVPKIVIERCFAAKLSGKASTGEDAVKQYVRISLQVNRTSSFNSTIDQTKDSAKAR